MASRTVQETIDERLIKLLGLESEFEMSYEEYIRHLKEAMSASRMVQSKYSTEEVELITEEYKRIKAKKGRFIIKIKRVRVRPTQPLLPASRKTAKINPARFIPPSLAIQKYDPNQLARTQDNNSIGGSLVAIRSSVENLYTAFNEGIQLEQDNQEEQRKRDEDLKRDKKEKEKETKKGGGLVTAAKKALAPVQGILDAIVRFIVFTLLGKAFNMFMNWAKDPKNKEKVETLWRFLKDWWPALLWAWFLFANPLGIFIRKITATVLRLTFSLAKGAIPKLLSFIKAHPLISAGILTGAAASAGFMMEKNRRDTEIAKEAAAEGKTPEQKSKEIEKNKSWVDYFGNAFQAAQPGMGGVSPLGFSKGGSIFNAVGVPGSSSGITPGIFTNYESGLYAGYKKGGSVFSGVVDDKTGTTVTGAGPDTQYLPVEDGGGVVLQRGESVLQVGARERMIKQTGFDPLAFNIGPNANKPRTLDKNIFGSSFGGLVGMNKGGMIGGNLSPDFWKLAAISSREDFRHPQGQADIAQSIYNRAAVGVYPGGKSIGNIITAAGQYEPTFASPALWKSIKDRKTAKAAAGPKGNVDSAAKNITNPTLQQNARSFVGGRTDFMGESQKKYMKPGDITRGPNYNFHGWFYDAKLNSPAPIPKIVSSNISNTASPTKPKPPQKPKEEPNILQRITSGVSSMFGMNKPAPKKAGGAVEIKENTGSDFGPDGTKLSGADRRYIPGFYGEPGEACYIFTKTATERGAVTKAEELQALLDPSGSKAGRESKYRIEPRPMRGRSNIVTLPPITRSAGAKPQAPASTTGSVVPAFSVRAVASIQTIEENAERYGIV